MSPRKTTEKGSQEAKELARAAFAEAIATCAQEWKSRWGRPPTTHELVRAFDLCLASSPHEYVSDVGPVLAMIPAKPPGPATVDPAAFVMDFPVGKPFDAQLFQRKHGVSSKLRGDVWVHLGFEGDALIADVGFSEFSGAPRFDLACSLVRALVVPAFLERSGKRVSRIVMRPVAGVDDAITLEWPGAATTPAASGS